jgi:putative endonuclease
MSNKKNGVLYTGVTNSLAHRIYEHKNGLCEGFTKKYNLKILVHYEIFGDINYAIQREKDLKGWSINWKIKLIEKNNPDWKDLYDEVIL